MFWEIEKVLSKKYLVKVWFWLLFPRYIIQVKHNTCSQTSIFNQQYMKFKSLDCLWIAKITMFTIKLCRSAAVCFLLKWHSEVRCDFFHPKTWIIYYNFYPSIVAGLQASQLKYLKLKKYCVLWMGNRLL